MPPEPDGRPCYRLLHPEAPACHLLLLWECIGLGTVGARAQTQSHVMGLLFGVVLPRLHPALLSGSEQGSGGAAWEPGKLKGT